MRSFSTIFASILAISASALAYTTPTTFNVSSNPIYTPNTGSIVPAGVPYKITWGPTESGTVTIVLLQGPSTNVQPLYAIAQGIPNSGSFLWTPSTSLVPDTTHYGLQIIKDSDGQYQYSTQFGISNPAYTSVSSSASATVYTSASSYASSKPTTTSYSTTSQTTKSTSISLITITTSHSNTTSHTSTSTSASVSSHNVTSTSTTLGTTKSTTIQTPTVTLSNTHAPPTPTQTGAASNIKIASGLLIGVAVIAALLL